MSGGVMKRVWKPRDVGLFGCYRTDELFRALKSADGKTDFSGEGRIIKGDFRMKPLEKVALFACLLLSALNFFGADRHKEDSLGEFEPPDASAAQTEEVRCHEKAGYGYAMDNTADKHNHFRRHPGP